MCQRCAASSNTSTTVVKKMAAGVHRRFRHRQIPKANRIPANPSEVCGSAHLCFSEDHSRFQGSIAADNQTRYKLTGERVFDFDETDNITEDRIRKLSISESSDEESNTRPTFTQSYYRVTLIDQFSGITHTLPKIFAKRLADNRCRVLLSSNTGDVSFHVQTMLRGEEARVVINNLNGGAGNSLEKHVVYAGKMQIKFEEGHYEKYHRDSKTC